MNTVNLDRLDVQARRSPLFLGFTTAWTLVTTESWLEPHEASGFRFLLRRVALEPLQGLFPVCEGVGGFARKRETEEVLELGIGRAKRRCHENRWGANWGKFYEV